MKIVYKPVWGSQERWDFTVVKPELTCEPHEEKEALNSGWLIHNNHWYLTRSVRIKSRQVDLPNNYLFISTNNVDAFEVTDLWLRYLRHKQFSMKYDLFVDRDRATWLLLRDAKSKELISFTKFIQYNGGIESQFNAYKPGTMGLGRLMLQAEINKAFTTGNEYLYIGSGLEMSSAYKAAMTGFQWWDGSQWSTDAETYLQFCKSDSEITTIDQLAKLF